MGTVSGAGEYFPGERVALRATPASGFVFQYWKNDEGNIVSYLSDFTYTIPSDDETLTACFGAVPVYPLSLQASPTAGGNPAGAGSYIEGAQVAVNANTDVVNYTFVNWTNAAGTILSTNGSYTYQMPAIATTLYANYRKIPRYALTIEASPANGGIVAGAGNYKNGEVVTVQATANTPGFEFINWTDQVGTVLSAQASYSFNMDAATKTYYANFREIPKYQITAVASPTVGGAASGTGEYYENTPATLTATANTGYQFVNWTDELGVVVGNQTTLNVTVTMAKTFTANFRVIPTYTLTVSASPNTSYGTVSGSGLYNEGTSVNAIAIPKTGYQFVNWTEGGNEVSTLANYQFVMNSNRTLVANFKVAPVVIGELTFKGDTNLERKYGVPIDEIITAMATISQDATVSVTVTSAAPSTFRAVQTFETFVAVPTPGIINFIPNINVNLNLDEDTEYTLAMAMESDGATYTSSPTGWSFRTAVSDTDRNAAIQSLVDGFDAKAWATATFDVGNKEINIEMSLSQYKATDGNNISDLKVTNIFSIMHDTLSANESDLFLADISGLLNSLNGTSLRYYSDKYTLQFIDGFVWCDGIKVVNADDPDVVIKSKGDDWNSLLWRYVNAGVEKTNLSALISDPLPQTLNTDWEFQGVQYQMNITLVD